MAKILKRRNGAMSERQLLAIVRASAQQIWLAGLGAFLTARKEGNKVFAALVKEGETIHSLMQKAARARIGKATDKAAATRDRLAQSFENSVARALQRFGVPTRKGLDTLSKRVAVLSALVDEIGAEAARKRATAKRAARGKH